MVKIRFLSVCIRVQKIFVLFEKLLPVGQWVFDKSRVQKNIRVLSVIRVLNVFVLAFVIRNFVPPKFRKVKQPGNGKVKQPAKYTIT